MISEQSSADRRARTEEGRGCGRFLEYYGEPGLDTAGKAATRPGPPAGTTVSIVTCWMDLVQVGCCQQTISINIHEEAISVRGVPLKGSAGGMGNRCTNSGGEGNAVLSFQYPYRT